MATDDIQRLVTGQAPAPAQFTVPGNGQIQPKCVRAEYDGTGASGPFLPVLRFISDAGITVGEFVGPEIAAGGSADVSWFPHVAEQAAATGVTGVSGDYQVDPITIAGGGFAFVPWLFITGTQVLDLTDPTTPKVTVAGVYSVSASMTPLNDATTNNFFTIDLRWNWPSASNSHMQDTGYAGVLTDRPFAAVGYTVAMSVNDTFRLLVVNGDSAARDFASANVPVTRIT